MPYSPTEPGLHLVPLPTPQITMSGIQYYAPICPPVMGCRHCVVRDICRQVVLERDGLALCEQLLPDEILPAITQAVVAVNLYEQRHRKAVLTL